MRLGSAVGRSSRLTKSRSGNPFAYYGKPLLAALLAWVAICAAIITLGGENVRSNYWHIIAINIFYLTIVSFLIWLVFDVRQDRFKLPNVKMLIEDLLILVCEPEGWLGYGSRVAIFYNEGGYERPLADGYVYNIQANGLIQIKLYDFEQEDEASLRERVTSIQFDDIVIKPGQDFRSS